MTPESEVVSRSAGIWRSMLFVPANNDKFIQRAHTRGADAYILDLEDSVPITQKAQARDKVIQGASLVSIEGASVLVRINCPLRLAVRDVEAVVDSSVAAIVLPKVDSAEQVRLIESVIDEIEIEKRLPSGHTKIIAQIESAKALPRLDEIARSSSRLLGMILGSEDYSASVGMEPSPKGLLRPNQDVLIACRGAGILPLGFPASIADFSNEIEFRKTIKLARSLGFVGAFCVHPRQVAIMNEEFVPSESETASAEKLLTAFEKGQREGKAVIEYEGKMIDPPVVARAKEILRMARYSKYR